MTLYVSPGSDHLHLWQIQHYSTLCLRLTLFSFSIFFSSSAIFVPCFCFSFHLFSDRRKKKLDPTKSTALYLSFLKHHYQNLPKHHVTFSRLRHNPSLRLFLPLFCPLTRAITTSHNLEKVYSIANAVTQRATSLVLLYRFVRLQQNGLDRLWRQ